MTALWEILVPTEKQIKSPSPQAIDFSDRDDFAAAMDDWQRKNSYSTRYHRVWDEKVRAISGGLTIMAPVKGEWAAPCGTLFRERMIPVRIVANREQIDKIIDLTLEYYDQLAVLCYKLSDEVILKNRVTYPQGE